MTSDARERVLVTGGAGFLGARLTRDLVRDGHDVHLLLRPGPEPGRLARIAGHYTAHPGDLLDPEGLRRVVRDCRPDVVYHCAAYGVYPGQRDRATVFRTNVMGTVHLLDALEGHDYRRLVHLGSSAEYGHKDGPIREDDLPRPRTDYGVAKAAATLLCQSAALKGRPATTVRIFCAYGPGEARTRLTPSVMASCARGEPARVSAGWQSRDFIHVDDVVELLRVAARHPAAPGRILHAATGRQHTVRDLVECVRDVTGCPAPARYGAEAVRGDEPTTWVASIEATTALVGWAPRYDLRQGVRRTWEEFTAADRRGAA